MKPVVFAIPVSHYFVCAPETSCTEFLSLCILILFSIQQRQLRTLCSDIKLTINVFVMSFGLHASDLSGFIAGLHGSTKPILDQHFTTNYNKCSLMFTI